MKNVFCLIKKIILAVLFLYSYNFISASFNLIIPINIITVGAITILGVPALLSLIAIYFIVF